MQIVRFTTPATGPRVGLLDAGAITAFDPEVSVSSLLALSLDDLRARCEAVDGDLFDADGVTLLAPVDGRTEVWAAGVTYENSRLARIEESEHDSDIYVRVYEAERPELFFKSVSWKVRGPGDVIGIRDDSLIDVPEPEVAVVVNASGEVVGLTICNDVSSRSLEAENPLYLPQAKIFAGACAVGPGIRPVWEVEDAYALTIRLEITRNGFEVWSGTASTQQLKRTFAELVGALTSADSFPEGAVLSTGTCVVPALPFTLEDDDVVTIAVDGLGELVNTVRSGRAARTSRVLDDAVV